MPTATGQPMRQLRQGWMQGEGRAHACLRQCAAKGNPAACTPQKGGGARRAEGHRGIPLSQNGKACSLPSAARRRAAAGCGGRTAVGLWPLPQRMLLLQPVLLMLLARWLPCCCHLLQR